MFGLVPFMTRNSGLATRDNAFDRLMDAFEEPFFTGFSRMPEFKVDVKDSGDAYDLSAELPGMKKEDISLKYEDGYLTISTMQESSNEEKDEQGSYVRRERSTSSMSRSFYIDHIDESKCTASYEDGVLKVHMPKVEPVEEKSHKIEITGAA